MKYRKDYKWILYISTIISIIFFLSPIIALLIKSKFDFIEVFNEPMVINAIIVSLKSTLISICIIILIGLPTAYFLARKNFKGKYLIELIFDLPMVLPPSVAGILLLITFGRNGIIGEYLYSISIQIPFTFYAVLVAQIFVSMPIFIRTVRTGIEGIDKDLELTAELLGDSKREVFFRITLPLAKNSIKAGIILSWARALGEFGATMMFAGNIMGKTQTLPLAIYMAMENNLYASLAIAMLLIIICICILTSLRFITAREKI